MNDLNEMGEYVKCEGLGWRDGVRSLDRVMCMRGMAFGVGFLGLHCDVIPTVLRGNICRKRRRDMGDVSG